MDQFWQAQQANHRERAVVACSVGIVRPGWHNRQTRCASAQDFRTGTKPGYDTDRMTDSTPLDALLQRAARGDETAFEQLYGACCKKLYATAYYILKNEALAEEVLQEACIKIWNNASRFDAGKASALTWMNRIVRNRALDVLRSQKSRPTEIASEWEGPEHASENPGPLDLTDIAVSSEALSRCLDVLKEQQREVILMAYLYGHTHDELSRITGSPLGTIKAWIRRGLESLRQCLG